MDEQQRAGAQHRGLLGMHERALSCGGSVRLESWPHCGTVVRVWLPLERNAVE